MRKVIHALLVLSSSFIQVKIIKPSYVSERGTGYICKLLYTGPKSYCSYFTRSNNNRHTKTSEYCCDIIGEFFFFFYISFSHSSDPSPLQDINFFHSFSAIYKPSIPFSAEEREGGERWRQF